MSVEATIRVDLTPEKLAAIFCEYDAGEMAEFFDDVARIAQEEWPKGSWFKSCAAEMQWDYMRRELSVRALATLMSMSRVLWKSGRREYAEMEALDEKGGER